ncbi:prephenate dehydratase [Aliidiomarina sp. Khilg15.8]
MQIATLGPAGTFSAVAADKFRQDHDIAAEVVYFSHLQRVLRAAETDCAYAVVPIENVSEGFVPVVLDYLVKTDLRIVSELRLPIAFAAVGNLTSATSIKRLYVQFVARGQCRDFIESLGDVELIATESNTESLALARDQQNGVAAIVPAHLVDEENFTWQQRGVQDFTYNETRFLLLSREHASINGSKTSLLVINQDDRPGLLERVLHCFSSRRLNLSSIVSRPTGQGFGNYHFFIDVQSAADSIAMRGALAAVADLATVKVLGCY